MQIVRGVRDGAVGTQPMCRMRDASVEAALAVRSMSLCAPAGEAVPR